MLKRKWQIILTASVALLLCFGNAVMADDDKKAYLAQLETNMQSAAMNDVLPMNDMAQIQSGIDTIEDWARLLNRAGQFQYSEAEYAVVTAFKDKARAAQTKLFPMLRQATGYALQQELGAVKVSITGDNFVEIRFTSPALKDMGMTRKIHEDYDLLFKRLRFKQAAFMLDHEDISTLARFQPPKDDGVIMWDAEYKSYAIFN